MNKLINNLTVPLQKNDNTSIFLFLIITASLLIHLFCMSTAKLFVEEAYYWNYSQHLDFSYLDHPPMVALLIKLFTSILGTYEFSIRCSSLFCWLITAFYSYKLTELISPNSGRYALLLLAVLPFFFFQSVIITPDVPLIACWSASLYFLYRALVLKEAQFWYIAGLFLGLGMLSKYTICLLSLGILGYAFATGNVRFWLKRKEPYVCALITMLLFTPVIYWNATHEWISFIFQSSRRFATTSSLNIHNLIWIIFFFLTPLGVLGIWELCEKGAMPSYINQDNKKFIQCFTLIPLAFFAFFSLNHQVNLTWTGPLFLALIPWLATLMAKKIKKRSLWLITSLLLLVTYSSILLVISYNKSELIQQKLLLKVIAWDDLIKQLHAVAQKTEQKTHHKVLFVPLDNYPISSELTFYQAKFLAQGEIKKTYSVVGAHIFNLESLMYRYWSSKEDLSDTVLILVSKEKWRFDESSVSSRVQELSKLSKVWSLGQGQNLRNIPYYYKVVKLKT